jgi:AraC family L-rhamnose operon transcriptional activator RhaR
MLPTYHESDLFGRAAIFAAVYDVVRNGEVHGHDFVEIAVVGGGTGFHETSTGHELLSAGDVLVLRPGAWHGFSRCSHLIVANTCLSLSALGTELAFLRDVPGVAELIWRSPVRPGRHGLWRQRTSPSAAAAAVSEIAELGELIGSKANQARIFGQLLTVLSYLVQASPVASRYHPAVAATAARIDDDPAHPWSMEELSKLANLDAAYLTRLFRRDLGLPPMGYLARVRAERAAALLTRTEYAVARVGALVGWPDPTYFARRFRALVGLTPTAYRAKRLLPEAEPI